MGVAVMRLAKLDRKVMTASDIRVKSTNEAIQAMLGIKVSSWEDALLQVVELIRAEEVSYLHASVYMRATMGALMASTPAFSTSCALATYALVQNGVITPAVLFSAIQTFAFLRVPLMFLPMALAQTAQALVSVRRIESFLALEEIGPRDRKLHVDDEKVAVVISEAKLIDFTPVLLRGLSNN
jgi:ABC-type multidrug transport system fused ATPase/permease subunit